MKKTKLLSSIFALSTLATATTVATSCSDNKIEVKQTNNSKNLNSSKICTIVFEKGEADNITGNLKAEVKYERKFGSIDAPIATKSGCSFTHWKDKTTNQEYCDSTKIKNDATLIPCFENSDISLSFNTSGGTKIETKSITYGLTWDKIKDTVEKPTKEDAEFDAWLLNNGEEITDDYEFIENTTLTARYIEDVPAGYCKVNFDTIGGGTINSQIVRKGKTCVCPETPTKSGYIFDYWHELGKTTAFDFTTPINDSITLYANWTSTVDRYCTGITNQSTEDSTLTVTHNGSNTPNIEYSTDGTSWNTLGTTLTIAGNTKIYLRGLNDGSTVGETETQVGFSSSTTKYSTLKITGGNIKLSGSIMGLLDKGTGTMTQIPCSYCFYNLFEGSTGITEIDKTFLECQYFNAYCYCNLFNGCTAITNLDANLLQSTVLAEGCYQGMFYGCTGLTVLPDNLLPATILRKNCYNQMFAECTGLTEPSVLPTAKSVADGCYEKMYYNCTSLKINCIEGRKIYECKDSSCASNMFSGTKGLFVGTPIANYSFYTGDYEVDISKTLAISNTSTSASTLTINNTGSNTFSLCYSNDEGANWNSLDAGGAVTIAANSKIYLRGSNFEGFSKSTTKYTSLALTGGSITLSGNILGLLDGGAGILTSIPTTYCFAYLFSGATGIKSINSSFLNIQGLTDYCYYHMFNGCTGLTSLQSGLLPATTLTSHCYDGMFYQCTGLTSLTAGLMSASTLATGCYYEMFYGCTGLTSVPAGLLPVTNLTNAGSCYYAMFKTCTGLTSIPANFLPATTLATSCYHSMFYGCTNLSTVNCKLQATVLPYQCYREMFSGCYKKKSGVTYGLQTVCSGFLPSEITQAANYALYQMFNSCKKLSSVNFNFHISQLGSMTMYGTFYACTALTVTKRTYSSGNGWYRVDSGEGGLNVWTNCFYAVNGGTSGTVEVEVGATTTYYYCFG